MDGSGDNYVLCQDGVIRWGPFGAAGLLFCLNEGEPRFFLVHRSPLVDQGDTWGIPGGARDNDETALEAAWREALEELVGLSEMPHHVLGKYVDTPSPDWSYTTFAIQVYKPFHLSAEKLETDEAWETQDAGWFTRQEIEDLDLHPAFRSLWSSPAFQSLLPEVSALDASTQEIDSSPSF